VDSEWAETTANGLLSIHLLLDVPSAEVRHHARCDTQGEDLFLVAPSGSVLPAVGDDGGEGGPTRIVVTSVAARRGALLSVFSSSPSCAVFPFSRASSSLSWCCPRGCSLNYTMTNVYFISEPLQFTMTNCEMHKWIVAYYSNITEMQNYNTRL
jgi:hypothetical protein